MDRNAFAAAVVVFSLIVTGGSVAAAENDQAVLGCRTGAWILADGRTVTITPSGDNIRWRTLDGSTALVRDQGEIVSATTGWTEDADPTAFAFGDCDQGLTQFDGQTATRLAFDIIETRFQGEGETLAGRLILPRGDGPVPIMVEVHGSEDYSAVTFNAQQYLGPASGVGVFVYDKRGTGGSTGTYTQDFSLLAADAAAAVREAQRLAGHRLGRVGLHGASQGGWIAPLAAGLAPVDFVIVSYGLTLSPLEENRAETVQDVAEAGFDAEAQRKAGLLADAAGVVMASRFRSGFSELNALKREWRDEPWFGAAQGEFTGDLARHSEMALRIFGPRRDRGTTWDHQSEPPLRALDVPLLWILAGADRDAPPEETRALLGRLQGEGKDITIVEFADTDHGMVEFRQAEDGSRVNTGFVEGYFPLMIDFALGQSLRSETYERGLLTLPASTGAGRPE